MRAYPKKLANRVIESLANRVAQRVTDSSLDERVANRVAASSLDERVANRVTDSTPFIDTVAYRVALELIFNSSGLNKEPHELFSGISNDYWLWLHTEGYRRHPMLRRILPGMPSEDIQLSFTGNTGDAVLRDAFTNYKVFTQMYEDLVSPVSQCGAVLDFGCGWGRVIRFFIKDLQPSALWGVDPVEEMIAISKENKWCNFKTINTRPPLPFQDDTFDLIYSVSVFSHLSEEMHHSWLLELTRVLKPGGLLMATTRQREFIEFCAELRARADLDSLTAGISGSAAAFLDTQQSLSDYDSGKYCYTQLIHEGEWSYWGDTAIPKAYVLNNWTSHGLTFVDYIDDRSKIVQNVIVMRKSVASS